VVLTSCRILTSIPLGGQSRLAPYVAEFEVDGRTYRCALYGFLPRTQVLDEGRAATV